MQDIHAQVVEMLPWYVNGTLPPQERQLIESHVGECLPCRRALRDERALQPLVRRAAVPPAERAGLDRLLDTIDRSSRPGPRHGRTMTSRLAVSARPLALAAAASLALVTVGVWIARQDTAGLGAPPEFSTLSRDAESTETRIDVIFAPGVSPAAIESMLERLNATVTAGPSAIGRYTLTLPAGSDVDGTLTRLQADPSIRFAGPSFIDGESP